MFGFNEQKFDRNVLMVWRLNAKIEIIEGKSQDRTQGKRWFDSLIHNEFCILTQIIALCGFLAQHIVAPIRNCDLGCAKTPHRTGNHP